MNKLIFFITGVLIINSSFAQDQYPAFEYDYDLAGNRIKRTYVLYTPPDPELVERGKGTSFNNNVKQYNETNLAKPETEDQGREIVSFIKF